MCAGKGAIECADGIGGRDCFPTFQTRFMLAQDFDAAIGRTLIHDETFYARSFLRQDGIKQGAQRDSVIVGRDDDAEQTGWIWHGLNSRKRYGERSLQKILELLHERR